MHDIQKYVIGQLVIKNNCRYRDIKPLDVEGNLFMYHLRQLMQDGLVQKVGIYYLLTDKGLALADTLSLQTLSVRVQPKIVTLIACQNERGEWLLYERKKQPFRGMIGFPYGKIHLGEKIAEAAKRELLEKTGLTGELVRRGDMYVTVAGKSGELISHMLFHIFSCQQPIGTLLEQSDIGRCFWSEVSPNSVYMPGFMELFKQLQTGKSNFFLELSY